MASEKKPKTKKNTKESSFFTRKPIRAKTGSFTILPPQQDCCEYVNLNVDINVLFEGKESSVTSINNFLTSNECESWIEFGEREGFSLARHKQGNGIAHRDCGRLEIQSEEVAEGIFNRLMPFLPSSPNNDSKWTLDGCASNIRLYKYSKGQRFGKHYDESNDISPQKRTFFTVLVYLNGDGEETNQTKVIEDDEETKSYSNRIIGGETQFFAGHKQVNPVCSMAPLQGALLFHEHGERCLLHEGSVVSQGEKYLLRTDVVYKRSKR